MYLGELYFQYGTIEFSKSNAYGPPVLRSALKLNRGFARSGSKYSHLFRVFDPQFNQLSAGCVKDLEARVIALADELDELARYFGVGLGQRPRR